MLSRERKPLVIFLFVLKFSVKKNVPFNVCMFKVVGLEKGK